MRRVGGLAVVLAALLVALTACGDQTDAAAGSTVSAAPTAEGGTDDASDVPSSSPSPTKGPGKQATGGSKGRGPSRPQPCAQVWVADKDLPAHYRGCLRGGRLVEADVRMCSFGQQMVTFDNRYYAVLGKWVNDMGGPLDQSAQFRRASRSCSA